MKRILCSFLALGLLAGCTPLTGSTATAETAETAPAPTAAPQQLTVYYEAGAGTAAAEALNRYAEAQGVELEVLVPGSDTDPAQADLVVMNAAPAGDDEAWLNMGTDSLLSTAAIRAGVDAETAVSAVTALPLGKTLYGYWADKRVLGALFQTEDTDTLAADLTASSWSEWSDLAETLTEWLTEPAETTVTLNGTEYTLPAEKPEGAAGLNAVFTLPLDTAAAHSPSAAFTGVLLAAGDSRTEDALTGPLNGLYSAMTLELSNRSTESTSGQSEAAAALQAGEVLFCRSSLADLLVHTDADLQDNLVCLPLKCDFVESDIDASSEYNLTGLMNYPILATSAWMAIPAGTDEEGVKAAAAAILWLYTSEPGEETLTETLGLITPWGTASDTSAACQMQIDQVGAGILPEVTLTPAEEQALGSAGQALLLNEDGTFRTEFSRTDRDTWRDAVLAALVPADDGEE